MIGASEGNSFSMGFGYKENAFKNSMIQIYFILPNI